MGSGRKSDESSPLPQRRTSHRLSLRSKQTVIWLATALVASVAVIAAGLFALSDGAGGAADQAAVEPAPAGAAPPEREVAPGGGSGTATSQATAQSDPGAGGPSEGLKVHGDWTIQVFNSDGSLAQSVQFENALRLEGADALAAALAGNTLFTGGDAAVWALFLADSGTLLPTPEPGVSPCTVDRVLFDASMVGANPTLDTGCWLVTPDIGTLIPAGTPGFGTDLTGVIVPDAAGDIFSLTGSVVATQDGVIDFVESFVWLLDVTGGIPPSVTVVDIVDFTGTSLTTPVDVLTGQEIQVTFELSFQ